MLNPNKQNYGVNKVAYLEKIRAESLYPNFRGAIKFQEVLFYLAAVLCLLAGVLGILGALESGSPGSVIGVIIISLVSSMLLYATGKFFYEASSMIADLTDCMIASGHRQEFGILSEMDSQKIATGIAIAEKRKVTDNL